MNHNTGTNKDQFKDDAVIEGTKLHWQKPILSTIGKLSEVVQQKVQISIDGSSGMGKPSP